MVAATQGATDLALITGGDPDERFPVPFIADEFQEAPELDKIASALIERCHDFTDLFIAVERSGIEVRCRWRKKAARNADRFRVGTLQKTSGLLKHYSEAHYLIVVAVDATMGFTRRQMEALIYHELCHINIQFHTDDDTGETMVELKTHAHEVEMFHAEVKRYGLWRGDLKQASETFRQAGFTEMEPEKVRPIRRPS